MEINLETIIEILNKFIITHGAYFLPPVLMHILTAKVVVEEATQGRVPQNMWMIEWTHTQARTSNACVRILA
jgi:hypothetical protein